MPYALARKYPHAAKEWGWQYVFPARNLAVDPRSGVLRRHHVDPSIVNKAIKTAVQKTGLTNASVRTRSGTVLPRIFFNGELTFEPSRPCWDIMMYPQP